MKHIFTTLFALMQFSCPAQQSTHLIWTFGDWAGLDFHTQPPTPISTAYMYGWESYASQCDGQGDLLFYSNGQKVYNRQQLVMPHGDSLLGNDASTSQGVQVIPLPGNNNRYILLSLAGAESYYSSPLLKGGLYYSIIDMTLDNGLGDIVPGMKNILIDSLFSEHMMVITEGCKMWLVTHMAFGPGFRCYEITNQGLNTTPVVSFSGTSGNSFIYIRGEMAYDSVRKHIFLSTPDSTLGEGIFEMHDFDVATGTVSNPQLLDHDFVFYRLCISPNASKLYATGTSSPGNGVLYQFDVTQPTGQDIFNSGVLIHNSGIDYMHDIALGPDSMIYGITKTISDQLFRIAAPDMPGMSCNFTFNAITLLPGTNTTSGFPSPCIKRFSPPDVADETHTHDGIICDSMQTLSVPDSTYDIYAWSTGDTGMRISISQSGIYWVESTSDCKKRVDTFNITDFAFEPKVHDTIICFASSAVLTAPVSLPSYQWSDGSTANQLTITQPGTYWVFATDFCMETVDTFHVSFVDFITSLPGDTAICNELQIAPTVSTDGATYIWQDGSNGSTYTVSASGMYWVEVNKAGCRRADTMHVDNKALAVNLGNDTLLCENLPLILRLDNPNTTYLWQDGTTGNEYRIIKAGSYSVTANNSTCAASDTIQVAYEKCDCFFNIPTVFSPNQDGKNDLFQPLIEPSCPVSDYSLQIYNRWGERVFNATSPFDKWNGQYKGQLAEVGVYMYMLSFKGAKAKIYHQKGDITLIR